MSQQAKTVYTSQDIDNNIVENPPLREGTGRHCFAFNKTNRPANSPLRTFARVTLDPGSAMRPHRHNDDGEIYYILSGSGEYTDNDGKTWPVSTGDCAVCLMGEGHAIRNTGTEPLVFLGIVATGKE